MAALGSLVVSLTAQTAQFTQALDRASYQSKKNFDSMVSTAKMAGAAIGVALSSASFVRSIKAQIDLADELVKTSQKIGVQVEDLQKLRYAADLSGVSSESLTKALSRISSEAVKGSDSLKNLGVSVRDSNGVLKSSDQILIDVAEKVSKYNDGVSKTAIVTELFGDRIARDLLPFLNMGAKGIAELSKEAEQLGFIIGTETANAAERFNDNLTRLGRIKDGLVAKIAQQLLPAMENLTDELIKIAKQSNIAEMASKAVLVVFQSIAVLGANVAFVFEQVGKAIGTAAFAAYSFARGEFTNAINAFKSYNQEAESGRKKLDAFEKMIMGLGKSTVQASRDFNKGKGDLDDFSKSTDKVGDAIDRLRKEYISLFVSKKEIVALDLQALGANKDQINAAQALVEAIEKESKAKQNLLKIQSEAKTLFEQTRSPAEALNIELARLNELLTSGAINWDVYSRAVFDAQDRFDAASKSGTNLTNVITGGSEAISTQITLLQDYANRAKDLAESLDFAAVTGLRNFEDKLIDVAKGTSSVKDAFKSMTISILEDLLRIQIRQSITGPLSSFLSGAIGGFTGTQAAAPITTYDLSGVRAMGGPVSGGSSYLVGERGPEIFTPYASGAITPNSGMQASAPPEINIKNINVLDPAIVGNYLATSDGERVILNIIQRNRGALA